MNKVILLTGASGRIGKELFNKLEDFDCYGIYFKNKLKKNKKTIKLDLRNKKKLNNLILKIKPETVIHLAGMPNPTLNDRYPDKSKELNLGITKNLVRSLNNKTHFIFFSTDKVYDGEKNIYSERSKTLPVGFYGKYKLKCESIIRKKFKKHHIFRVALTHSNGLDPNFSIIDKSIFLLKHKSKIEIFYNIKRCFVSVEQLVNFIPKVLKNRKYGIYNIGSGLFSYSNRLKKICRLNKINFKKNLIEVKGYINPISLKLKINKLSKNFKIKFL
jgi:dTDP-4-dehydrorhamnose reductase